MNASVLLINPKFSHNVAAAIRACSCFGVKTLMWTGTRIDPNEYTRLPREERMKGYRDVTWRAEQRPMDFLTGTPICVEITQNAQNLVHFEHPDNAVYIFGPEDGGVPQVYRRFAHQFIFIPAHHCLNLSAALNVILYDRKCKRIIDGLESPVQSEQLHEDRGLIAVPGWDGQ